MHHLKTENMKGKRKPKSKLHILALVWGIIFSAFMLLTIGLKFIVSIFEKGTGSLSVSSETFITWDDPAPYFISYIIGYAVIWWKPFWGSIIIMAASIYYVLIAGFAGPTIFAAPGFLVGALYFSYWFIEKRNQTNTA